MALCLTARTGACTTGCERPALVRSMDTDIAKVDIDMFFFRMCYGKEILKTLATDMTMFFHQLLCFSCCMIDAIRATRTDALVQ